MDVEVAMSESLLFNLPLVDITFSVSVARNGLRDKGK